MTNTELRKIYLAKIQESEVKFANLNLFAVDTYWFDVMTAGICVSRAYFETCLDAFAYIKISAEKRKKFDIPYQIRYNTDNFVVYESELTELMNGGLDDFVMNWEGEKNEDT